MTRSQTRIARSQAHAELPGAAYRHGDVRRPRTGALPRAEVVAPMSPGGARRRSPCRQRIPPRTRREIGGDFSAAAPGSKATWRAVCGSGSALTALLPVPAPARPGRRVLDRQQQEAGRSECLYPNRTRPGHRPVPLACPLVVALKSRSQAFGLRVGDEPSPSRCAGYAEVGGEAG
jgi:hypothetical protein